MPKNALPAVGTKLYARHKGQEFSAEIVADNSSSESRVVEMDDKRFRSLSGAAMSIVGHNVNG